MTENNHKPAAAARAIGTTQSALRDFLDRKKSLGDSLAPRIAKYLGMPELDLFQAAGLAPTPNDQPSDYYEARIREMFSRATEQQKRQIVNLAAVILDNGDVQPKRKLKPSTRQHRGHDTGH